MKKVEIIPVRVDDHENIFSIETLPKKAMKIPNSMYNNLAGVFYKKKGKELIPNESLAIIEPNVLTSGYTLQYSKYCHRTDPISFFSKFKEAIRYGEVYLCNDKELYYYEDTRDKDDSNGSPLNKLKLF